MFDIGNYSKIKRVTYGSLKRLRRLINPYPNYPKEREDTGCQSLTLGILATWEAEIRRIVI
jgi:hypothetical protein